MTVLTPIVIKNMVIQAHITTSYRNFTLLVRYFILAIISHSFNAIRPVDLITIKHVSRISYTLNKAL